MSDAKVILEGIISNFSREAFVRFFREKSRKFTPLEENWSRYNDPGFIDGYLIGEINYTDTKDCILICSFKVNSDLSERSGKRAQYDKAKGILREERNNKYSAAIFIFYDSNGNFRFSLIYPEFIATKKLWNNFRRFTYFVSKEFTNKTFLKQIGEKDFSSLSSIKSAFSINAVTDLFYDEFFVIYNNIVRETVIANKLSNEDTARDFVLLFAIRTIFLGFIQKKKWIGNNDSFMQSFYAEYKAIYFGENNFFLKWLTPLFFEALNSEYGKPVAYKNNAFSEETEKALLMAPYLNGGLFREKNGYDDKGWFIPDNVIGEFFDFLFAHSFTIEENSIEDEDLQLNPEFLGIIFERLVNKENGAVYTPRTEVDLMCRLTLVKWLQKNLSNNIKADNLYELFFKESENEDEQKTGSFSLKETQEILSKLESLSICDPAVGSGAFLVGMIQVLDDVEEILKDKHKIEGKSLFERKKQIIKDSLYGVEVKEWAVWICQLRLWLSLFIDAPDILKESLTPILPSLDFKVRQGDSLVQRVGSRTFPVSGHSNTLNKSIKEKITKLKNLKLEFYDNKSSLKDHELKQKELAIYNEILDLEIKEKQSDIKNLSEKPAVQISLLDVKHEAKQVEMDLNKGDVERLKKEIQELEDQKLLLSSNNKPLLWSIEFAEVFGEKEGFDIIIGNPPYVRQESIADPTGRIADKKEYKKYLQEMVHLDFPDDFPPKAKINAQSDLYMYFYIRGLRLLNSKGVHTFICSNSWLDVGYGVWLQKFLMERAAVDLIIDNHSKRSFAAADVNTIITIIHAPAKDRKKHVLDNHFVKFAAFKQPFEEVIFTENMLAIEDAKEIISNDAFRVYPITNKDLKDAGTEYEDNNPLKSGKYTGDKWGGKYLRAPDIFFTILEKGKGKLVKLGDIAEVRRGFTTGCNEFFYLTDLQANEWGIEEEFLKPVIKSPRECKSILVDPKDLKFKIFMCNKSKAELKGTNALKYIEWGEKQKTKDNVFWKDVPSVQGRKYWWGLGERKICSFVVPCSFSDSYKIYKNNHILVDKRMYEGISKDKNIFFILNTTFFPLFMELGSRVGLGEGLLDVTVEEVEKIRLINPNLINVELNIPNRQILSVFEECGIDPQSDIPIEEQEPSPLADRAELDNIVFDALELTPEERKEVYRAVCRLVWNRISKANSVN